MNYTNYEIEAKTACDQLMPMKETLKQQLEYRLKQAQTEVARNQELLTLLEANPEVERILELMQGRI